MNKNEIISILEDWNFWKRDLPTGIERPDYLSRLKDYLRLNQVIVITGARRAGKSFIMRQFLQMMVSEGREREETLFVNFEDPRFTGLDAKTVQRIFEVYQEVLKPARTPVVFLDEVQEVSGWEKWVRSIQELGRARVIISGSNARLLSRELSTLLTGRHLDLVVFPLSFREFLGFRGLDLREELDLFSERIRIQSLFREYMEFGAFPEVVLAPEKKTILISYYDDVLAKDLVRRFRIRKTRELKALAKFYFSNVSSPVTFNSMRKFLGLSTDTVQKFSGYLESGYLVFFLPRFSYKVREQEKSPRKVYAVDTGLAQVAGFQSSPNRGRMGENLVAGELKRRAWSSPGTEIFYWKDLREREVDFVVKSGRKVEQGIQVCWDLSDERTRKRELKAVLKAARELRIKDFLLLNEEVESEEELGGGTRVKYLPLWKWLLEPLTSIKTK